MVYELGVSYIHLSGTCEYVVWDQDPAVTPFGSWSAARQGRLDEAQEHALNAAFVYNTWPRDNGSIFGPESNLSDAPFLVLFDGEHKVVCQRPCGTSAPHLEQAINVEMTAWIKRLYDLGVDLNGPMRLRAAAREVGGLFELNEWPLSETPQAVVAASGEPSAIAGPAVLVTDAVETARLRGMRERLFGVLIKSPPAYAKHEDPMKVYTFVFRDVSPFEAPIGEVAGTLTIGDR